MIKIRVANIVFHMLQQSLLNVFNSLIQKFLHTIYTIEKDLHGFTLYYQKNTRLKKVLSKRTHYTTVSIRLHTSIFSALLFQAIDKVEQTANLPSKMSRLKTRS